MAFDATLLQRLPIISQVHLRWTCWKWGREQCALREQVIEKDSFTWTVGNGGDNKPLKLIGGLDISFFDGESRACAALIILEYNASDNNFTVVWEDCLAVRMTEPYVAGYMAFREVPHYRALLDRVETSRPDLMPDVLLVDGNGVLHPRGFGSASHLGVVHDVCVVGVGKNLHLIDGLSREQVKQQMQTTEQGGHALLTGESGRVWGAALLPSPSQPTVPKRLQVAPKNPIFVSVGHRISLESAIQVVSLCCTSARIPEPVRLADIRSREYVREVKEKEQKAGVVGPFTWEKYLWRSLGLAVTCVILVKVLRHH
eukprot:gnl/MRDRNA2_/MRDRNA2_23352_c0_seq1.p1 gnl/MRDRNA2_/MRDRNA2_23352_c0~~gnl/MRDRNA2_/MRDRNA2_23352_c0_seq1.p1  ORF type:complete len:314 (-),score=32.08 gnl/MRDRNA2_/MRDRNA2_23352_c0_seq1:52-993(-)